MAGTLFDPQDRQRILDRVSALTPASTRRWGRMTVHQVVPHMADQLRMALKEIPASPPRGLLRFAPLRWLSIHVVPWPRGRTKAPHELFTTAPGELEADIRELKDLVVRFAAAGPDADWPDNPLFGRISGHDWGVLAWRHMDHHLTQFGA
jgi:hypothetical protein